MREAKITRKTKETEIRVVINLDGTGNSKIETPSIFLNHMLASVSKHSLFDIKIKSEGDLVHHIIEDTAITLGEALNKALGDKAGIFRFGWAIIPMDDSLARVSVDLGGRPYCVIDTKFEDKIIEDLATNDIKHFLFSFCASLKANIHIHALYGDDDHHKAEAIFKALAVALRKAVSIDPRRKEEIPSVKEVL